MVPKRIVNKGAPQLTNSDDLLEKETGLIRTRQLVRRAEALDGFLHFTYVAVHLGKRHLDDHLHVAVDGGVL